MSTVNMEDLEAIKTLKARYFRAMDTKDWGGWRSVFTEDGSIDCTEEAPQNGVIVGREECIAFVSGQLEGITTCHHGHMPEIELTSPSTASGIWAMEDHLWLSEGHPLGFRQLHGYGHYHETYEKIDGAWYIKTLRLTRLRIDVEM